MRRGVWLTGHALLVAVLITLLAHGVLELLNGVRQWQAVVAQALPEPLVLFFPFVLPFLTLRLRPVQEGQ